MPSLSFRRARSSAGRFSDISADDFDHSFEVTFRGVVDAVRAALPYRGHSGGNLLVVASMASRIPVSLHSANVAAKHALRTFLGCLRLELRNADSPMRVCMVHLGFVATPFFAHSTSAMGTRPHRRSIYGVEAVAAAVQCARRPRGGDDGGTAVALNLLQLVARPLSDRLLSTYGVWGPANRVAHRSARHPVGLLGKGRPIYARTLRRPAEPVDALRLRSIRALGRRTLKDGR